MDDLKIATELREKEKVNIFIINVRTKFELHHVSATTENERIMAGYIMTRMKVFISTSNILKKLELCCSVSVIFLHSS